jgi:prepilin-type N-terminal cleavage/methylation domain-containing protein
MHPCTQITAQTPRRRRAAPAAFTLLEVMISVAILSSLMLGMGSVVFLARKAMPDEKSGGSAILAASQGVELMRSDALDLTGVLSMTARGLSFTVADRNGDGSPEVISYQWSGVAGTPLTRSINNRAAATVVDNVTEFSLTYDHRKVALPATYSQGGEMLLASNETCNTGSCVYISTINAAGEYFKPNLPAGTVSWAVTRVQLRARSYYALGGMVLVQIRTADGIRPSANVLEQQSFLESQLLPSNSWVWVTVPFSKTTGLTPGTPLCLVALGQYDGIAACLLSREYGMSPVTDRYCLFSGNNGVSWDASQSDSLIYRVYGTAVAPNLQQYKYTLSSVRCTLRTGSDVRSRLQTTFRIANEPEVPLP